MFMLNPQKAVLTDILYRNNDHETSDKPKKDTRVVALYFSYPNPSENWFSDFDMQGAKACELRLEISVHGISLSVLLLEETDRPGVLDVYDTYPLSYGHGYTYETILKLLEQQGNKSLTELVKKYIQDEMWVTGKEVSAEEFLFAMTNGDAVRNL